MNTAFLLISEYDGKAVIPFGAVCWDYFSHLTPIKLIAKIVLWRVYRLARWLKQLIETVEGLDSRNVKYWSLTEAIDVL